MINEVTFSLEGAYNFNQMLLSIMESSAWDIEPESQHPIAFLALVENMTENAQENVVDAAIGLAKVCPNYAQLNQVLKHMDVKEEKQEEARP